MSGRCKITLFILISSISIIVYFNALDNPFYYDDTIYIVNNRAIEEWKNIPLMFTHPEFYTAGKGSFHYRPLLNISFALNRVIGGLDTRGYHAVNLALHIGAAYLVFLIVQAMLGGEQMAGGRNKKSSPPSFIRGEESRDGAGGDVFFIALASALIFAVHPFNSEVVNYITARSSVLSAFFYLLSFYFWIRYRKISTDSEGITGRKKMETQSPTTYYLLHTTYYIASLLTFLLGMLTKEVVVTLPIILWLYDLYFIPTDITGREGRWFHHLKRLYIYLPFILSVIIPYAIIRLFYWGTLIPSKKWDYLTHLFTQITITAKYFYLWLFPLNLSVFHVIEMKDTPLDLSVFLSGLVITVFLIVGGLLYKSKRRKRRLISFFIFWFFVTILPIAMVQLNVKLQENRGYLSLVGFSVMMAVLIQGISYLEKHLTHRVLSILIIIIILFYSGMTLHRNMIWNDPFTLWSDVLKKYPDSYQAYSALGDAYEEKGDHERALEQYKRSTMIYPFDYRVYEKMGSIYGQTGEFELALDMFKKALGSESRKAENFFNIGFTYYRMGNMDKAIEYYNRAKDISPKYIKAYKGIANVYIRQRDFKSALGVYERMINHGLQNADVYYYAGSLYRKLGETSKAIEYLKKARELAPGLFKDRKAGRD